LNQTLQIKNLPPLPSPPKLSNQTDPKKNNYEEHYDLHLLNGGNFDKIKISKI